MNQWKTEDIRGHLFAIIYFMNKIFKLISAILVCNLAGILGTFFVSDQVGIWYKTIQVPAWNPPDWIFAPVWLTLYTLMGIALYLVWNKEGKIQNKNFVILAFFLQLFFNFLWSIIFFGMHDLFLAFVEILFLIAMLIVTMFSFYKINKVSFVLLIPYLLWVSFVAYLNYGIWLLN